MLLKLFDLRLSSSRLPRILLLVMCLFDTFAVARPIGQELVPSHFPFSDQLQLIIDDTQINRVLCLKFEVLATAYCSPHESWSMSGVTKIKTVKLGVVLFTEQGYMDDIATSLSKIITEVTRGAPWEPMTRIMDTLASFHVLVNEEHPMETWEQTLLRETSTELRVESISLQDGKRSGDLRLWIGPLAIMFTASGPRLTTSSVIDESVSCKTLFSTKVYLRDEAAIEKVAQEMLRVSASPRSIAPWFHAVLLKEGFRKETMPSDGVLWNQIDTAITHLVYLPPPEFGFIYAKGAKY
ncbi:hypothetical protein EV361DRAFT_874903, partial [Lentinula raphanica]